MKSLKGGVADEYVGSQERGGLLLRKHGKDRWYDM